MKTNTELRKNSKMRPFRGLMVMLGAIALFLAFLAMITVAVHFIML